MYVKRPAIIAGQPSLIGWVCSQSASMPFASIAARVFAIRRSHLDFEKAAFCNGIDFLFAKNMSHMTQLEKNNKSFPPFHVAKRG